MLIQSWVFYIAIAFPLALAIVALISYTDYKKNHSLKLKNDDVNVAFWKKITALFVLACIMALMIMIYFRINFLQLL